MRPSTLVVLALTLASLALLAPVRFTAALAAWQENGIPTGIALGNQAYNDIATDGAGGAFIVYYDFRGGSADIYAQRVDPYGNALWTYGGIPVCDTTGNQYYAKIVSDGSGGAIIVWQDERSGPDDDLYAQRIDSSGTCLWAPNGVPISAYSGAQTEHVIAPDGSGGAVIAWMDTRNGMAFDIYAQRVDGSGSVAWTIDGAPVCTHSATQMYPHIAPDGSGGCIVVWEDLRNSGTSGRDIYAQRVDSLGAAAWWGPGIGICTADYVQENAELVTDGSGGAIVTWADGRRSFTDDIYAQHVDFLGGMLWPADGLAISADSGFAATPAITSDGLGGAIIVWRSTGPALDYNVYAQRVNALGARMWIENGITVSAAAEGQYNPEIAADGCGGAVIVWADTRGGDLDQDVFAQRVDAGGTVLWENDGAPACTVPGSQHRAKIIGDGTGGAIIAWDDARGGDSDVYAQRLGSLGFWGCRAPRIGVVEDVPGDQGGVVNVTWDASMMDPHPYGVITEYTVWRAIDPGLLSLTAGDGTFRLEQLASGGTFYWELVATVTARGMQTYAKPAATLFDSTSVCSDFHYFQVLAHGGQPDEWWASGPDSGRSVDNLAPGPPLNLAGDYQTPPGDLLMTWDPNMEADLSNYAVYRGATEDFVPDEYNKIGVPADTFFVDTEFNAGAQEYYKVSAVDIHENESGYALLRPEDISGADPGVPLTTALEQNAPNPFSPETVIRFSLAERGHVSLKVYDVKGRPVRTLADSEMAADRYEASWDGRDDSSRPLAPGVYFYKLEAPAYDRTMKMVLLR